MRYYTYFFRDQIIKRCPINTWSLNVPVVKLDSAKRSCITCRRFLQIIPTHPYKMVECTDERIIKK